MSTPTTPPKHPPGHPLLKVSVDDELDEALPLVLRGIRHSRNCKVYAAHVQKMVTPHAKHKSKTASDCKRVHSAARRHAKCRSDTATKPLCQCSPVAQRLTVFGEAMRVSHTSMMDTKQSAALKDWARGIRSKGHLRVCVGFQSALLHNLSVVCSTPYPCLTRPTTPLAFPPH